MVLKLKNPYTLFWIVKISEIMYMGFALCMSMKPPEHDQPNLLETRNWHDS